MGFIRFLLWTGICIGLGIFAASYEVDGKTPMQHLKAIYQATPHSVEGTLDKAKKAVATARQEAAAPTEQHSEADRDAINRLVAKRSK
jgi:hypothetical protein